MRNEAPLAVEMPSPERDRPAWVKVGVIAAVGFIVGVAWPRIVGVRLGPSAPGESAAAASAAPAARAPDAPPASVEVKTAVAEPSAAPVARAAAAAAKGTAAERPADKGPPKIAITKGSVLSCKTREGDNKSGKDCGAVTGLDLVVRPRVRNIATCAGAEGQAGKLVLVVNADFASGRFAYDVSRTSTVPQLDAIAACLKTSFEKTTIATGVPHDHPRYRVSYTATLSPGGSSAANDDATTAANDKPAEKAASEAPKPAAAAAAASAGAGEAMVAWEVALVRDTPKVGGVVARLPRGTKVKLGASKEGWYAVKFGDDFGEGGWVYRGAIGR